MKTEGEVGSCGVDGNEAEIVTAARTRARLKYGQTVVVVLRIPREIAGEFASQGVGVVYLESENKLDVRIDINVKRDTTPVHLA